MDEVTRRCLQIALRIVALEYTCSAKPLEVSCITCHAKPGHRCRTFQGATRGRLKEIPCAQRQMTAIRSTPWLQELIENQRVFLRAALAEAKIRKPCAPSSGLDIRATRRLDNR